MIFVSTTRTGLTKTIKPFMSLTWSDQDKYYYKYVLKVVQILI